MDEEEKKKISGYQIGQVLDELSVEELNDVSSQLKAEIIRLEEAAAKKSAHLSAADALFKR